MSTSIQPPQADAPKPPEIKSLERVTSIPLVQDSITAVQSTLQSYTPTAYAYATSLSSTAYNLSTPLQTRLAPLIVGADGLALKGLDVAEKTFPTPFTIKTEEVVDGVKRRSEEVVGAVTKPVYGLANGVDSSLTPFVDRLEEAIHKLGPNHEAEASTTSSDTAVNDNNVNGTQVARLYSLGVGLKEKVYSLSTEQLKTLQSQNVYIQNAAERVSALNQSLVSSFGTAKDMSKDLVGNAHLQAQAYSQSIVAEVEKIQAITLALPHNLQTHLSPIQQKFQETIAEISAIVTSKDIPVNEKASKVRHAVQEKVQPLLDQTAKMVQVYVGEAKAYLGGKKEEVEEEGRNLKVTQTRPVHDHEQDVPSFVAPVASGSS